jgi:hypothetical protein
VIVSLLLQDRVLVPSLHHSQLPLTFFSTILCRQYNFCLPFGVPAN